MILGTYHFGNPGMDLHNMKAENVLTPDRQQELDDIAARLAKFKPTRIAIEALSDRPDYSSQKYTEFHARETNHQPGRARADRLPPRPSARPENGVCHR